jgi:formiminoglutamase
MHDAKDVYRKLVLKYDSKQDKRLAHILCESTGSLPHDKSIYIIGVPDDRGVENNHGRVGAAKGPEVFRKYFGRLIAFEGSDHLYDVGDIPIQDTIADTHMMLAKQVKEIHESVPNALVIVIGGGHDYAYGEISGLIQSHPNHKIGICNIDAHLDCRPIENNLISSGTPFWRLWEDFGDQISYHLTYGVQRSAVSKLHLNYLKEKRSKVIFARDVFHRFQQEESLGKELEILFSSADRVALNIDLDAFSATYAPGVSAPSIFGLVPIGVVKVLTHYFENPFLKSLGIYELNPRVDASGDLTARLAAEMVYFFIEARVKAMKQGLKKVKKGNN